MQVALLMTSVEIASVSTLMYCVLVDPKQARGKYQRTWCQLCTLTPALASSLRALRLVQSHCIPSAIQP